jgi:two-component system sensor histidine kinase KdpD
VVKNKQPLYGAPDSACDVPTGKYGHYRGDAFFLVPIVDDNRVIGVVNVTDKIGDDMFEPAEREILLNIVSHVITGLENHRLAESLKQKKKSLQRKNAELKKLQQLRTELFNMLIHDLKGPLSDIVANLDILSYTISDENKTFVETAQGGCNTLYNMVSNLLDIARLEEGKLPLAYERISARDILSESRARLLVSGESKGIVFTEEMPEIDDDTLEGDRAMLLRVVQNFLSNAIQYSPEGGTIVIGYRNADANRIEFYVQDSGPGVPVDKQEAIFDKYMQIEHQADGREYTTGLGLTFSKMAVEAHGGTIGVQSDGKSGSRFYFTVPRRRKK